MVPLAQFSRHFTQPTIRLFNLPAIFAYSKDHSTILRLADYEPAGIAALLSALGESSSSVSGQHFLSSNLPTESPADSPPCLNRLPLGSLTRSFDSINRMNEGHEQDKPEPVDDVIEITNQQTGAVPTTHTSGGNLLSHVTQLATNRKDHVTFWSLPREVRDMIWSEVLGPEDDIFQANETKSMCNTKLLSSAHAHARINRYKTVRFIKKKGWHFRKVISAPILLSTRPPLPLAHLCQESRAFALQKYDAAYRKVRKPDLKNQERGGRFRWLSRSAVRMMKINIPTLDYDEADIQVPLGEDEPLIIVCHGQGTTCSNLCGPIRNVETNKQDSLKQTAMLLELLKKAKDHQIMICSHLENRGRRYYIDRNTARRWGVFADRAPGEDFAEDRASKWSRRTFVEVQDIFPMVRLLRDINRRGHTVDMRSLGLRTHIVRGNTTTVMSRIRLLAPMIRSGDLPYHDFTADGGFRRLEEEELFPGGNFVTNLKGREWLQEKFSECLKPFEELWAENVINEEDILSPQQSRYGRMPKIGLVVEYDAWYTWQN